MEALVLLLGRNPDDQSDDYDDSDPKTPDESPRIRKVENQFIGRWKTSKPAGGKPTTPIYNREHYRDYNKK